MKLLKIAADRIEEITGRMKSPQGDLRVGVSRRDAIKVLTAAATSAALSPLLFNTARAGEGRTKMIGADKMAPQMSSNYPFKLPPLPYGYDALTAAIDEETMRIHHDKHHQGYTNKLNAALEKHPELHDRSVVQLLADYNELPEDIRTAVKNNGGGYFNHALFWPMMSPNGGGMPSGKMAEAINRDFGSFDNLKKEFAGAAGSVFGSGWAYLVTDDSGKLNVMKYHNQDSPIDTGHKPVLGIDVWEHAYYLRYQNRRGDYIDNFWNVVNWNQANTNYTS